MNAFSCSKASSIVAASYSFSHLTSTTCSPRASLRVVASSPRPYEICFQPYLQRLTCLLRLATTCLPRAEGGVFIWFLCIPCLPIPLQKANTTTSQDNSMTSMSGNSTKANRSKTSSDESYIWRRTSTIARNWFTGKKFSKHVSQVRSVACTKRLCYPRGSPQCAQVWPLEQRVHTRLEWISLHWTESLSQVPIEACLQGLNCHYLHAGSFISYPTN